MKEKHDYWYRRLVLVKEKNGREMFGGEEEMWGLGRSI